MRPRSSGYSRRGATQSSAQSCEGSAPSDERIECKQLWRRTERLSATGYSCNTCGDGVACTGTILPSALHRMSLDCSDCSRIGDGLVGRRSVLLPALRTNAVIVIGLHVWTGTARRPLAR